LFCTVLTLLTKVLPTHTYPSFMNELIRVTLSSKLYFVSCFKAIPTVVQKGGEVVTVETWVL